MFTQRYISRILWKQEMQILLRRADEMPYHQTHAAAQQQGQRITCAHPLQKDQAP